MSTILYIHGFLSAPQSRKAQQTKAWLAEHYPHINFLCPQLSSYPKQAKATLDELIASVGDEDIYAIGSSLGGFWSTYLVENKHVNKAVLVNPAVIPHTRFSDYIDRPVKSYYTEEVFTLTQDDIDALCDLSVDSIAQCDKYWLMVQKGDETLDYRLAVDLYQGCKQLVEDGGSHTFDGYEDWLPEVVRFFGLDN